MTTLDKSPLRWCGGKTRLLDTLEERVPASITHYFEPFMGGAGLFFRLTARRRILRWTACLSDSSPALVNAFFWLRKSRTHVMSAYRGFPVTEEAFGEARKLATTDGVLGAAAFLFVNTYGFNGLWRVNGRGECNVPWGKRPTSGDKADLFLEAGCRLNKFLMGAPRCEDFAVACAQAKKLALNGRSVFVYMDPPYMPTKEKAFDGYVSGGFSADDHGRVAVVARQLVEVGARVMISNVDTPEVRAMYTGFRVTPVEVRRSVAASSSKRVSASEVIVEG